MEKRISQKNDLVNHFSFFFFCCLLFAQFIEVSLLTLHLNQKFSMSGRTQSKIMGKTSPLTSTSTITYLKCSKYFVTQKWVDELQKSHCLVLYFTEQHKMFQTYLKYYSSSFSLGEFELDLDH